MACLSSALTLSASNYDFVVDRLAYNITSATTVEVTNPGGEGKAPDVDYSGVINIPKTVTYNGTTYTVTGIGEYAFQGEPVTQVIIPNSVTYIDEYAFYICLDLTSVSIGSGVTTIGDFAFSLCENLRYVTCRAVTPPTIYGFTFKIMNGSGLGLDFVNLYVPSGSSSAYQSAAYWNQFGNISSIPSLKDALTTNAIEFTSTGSYPWMVMADVGGSYAMSGNAGVASSSSTLTGTVVVPTGGASLTFSLKAWGEGTSTIYDKCILLVDGTQKFSYGARDNDWETYTVQLAAGTHTLTWTYSKDSSVNPRGDYFAVKNVKLNVEAYAVYTSSNTTLTFYCDALRSSRTGTIYSLNTGSNYPNWHSSGTCTLVTNVVFDSSFSGARPTTTLAWFRLMSNLTSITGLSYLNTEKVTNMNNMFANCSSLTSLDVSNFNTANVTDMHYMFYGCNKLTNLDLSNFSTAKVTDMAYMFTSCSNLATIYAGSGWSTNAVTSSTDMFYGCTKLVGGQGTTYNSSHVDKAYAHNDGGTSNPGYFTDSNGPVAYACYTPSNTTLTFYYDTQRNSRTGTIYGLHGSNDPGWFTDGTNANVTKVVFNSSFANARPTSTSSWFDWMRNLTSITGLSYLNTENVTTMYSMFEGCNNLTSLDVSHFNTAKVTNMSWMFYECSGLTSLNLSSFNTANVTSMYNMFYGCKMTNLDLSKFNTAKVTNMGGMFYRCSNLTTIYAGSGWSTNAVTNSSNMFYGCTKLVGGQGTTYNSSHVDKAYAHIDGGSNNPGYFTEFKEAYACYTSSNKTLTFYYDGLRSSRTGTTYDLNEGEDNPGWYTDGTYANVTKVVFNSSFANARPTSTRLWFVLMSNLTSFTGLSYLNTENVTTMQSMFYGCNKFTSFDVSHFNTANVTNMNGMFLNCTSLTSLDLSNFNTSKVTNMYGLLYGCTSLTSVNLSSFNTSNVTKMGNMFYNCTSLTSLDLSNFNTAILTQTDGMFQGCRNITTIYVGSGWSTDAVTTSTGMFYSCTKLVGGKGTTYSSSHTNAAYAHIDGGPSNPGYFTASSQSGDVNGDGNVNISDVTALIDILLAGTTPPAGSDVNGDGNVNIADVTALIDMLLGS